MEQTEARPGAGRRLVLGFDAGCLTCSELANRIEERVGNRIEVRSLNDPMMDHWRKEVFGEDAPWAPTLVEVGGGAVKAWTGIRMGARLSRALGPLTTWRVMQVLGEANVDLELVDSAAVNAVSGLTRGQFLKGVGGAAVAMSVLSGTRKLSSEAKAEVAQGMAKSLTYTEIHSDELVGVARAMARRSDTANVMGKVWADNLQTGDAVRIDHQGQRVTAIGEPSDRIPRLDGEPVSAGRVAVKASRHKLEDGNSMLAIAYWDLDADRVMLFHEFEKPVEDGNGSVMSRAALHRVEGEEILLERLSVNGKLAVINETHDGSSSITRSRTCSGCRPGGNQYFRSYYCASIKWGCLLVACGACIPACATIIGCFYCAGIQCQYAYFVACCRRKGSTCFYCRR